MTGKCFVGIDTSNYTTSAALCDENGVILANIKEPLPVSAGGAGLRQSDAVFAHVKNLPSVMERLRAALGGREAAAVGCSVSPRDAEGSYMPCFLAGLAAAESFAAAAGIPVLRFSHQAGHIMAAAYSSGESERLMKSPFCAFHISGGTTELLRVNPCGERLQIETLGGTLDINAGQAIDRAGVAMGLKFPCGVELERLALTCIAPPPAAKICVRGLDCNLSGLENLAAGVMKSTGEPGIVAAFVIDFVGRTIAALSRNLREKFPSEPILYAGGVMSNSILKSMLEPLGNVFFAAPEYSSDNAAGVSLLCREAVVAAENYTQEK